MLSDHDVESERWNGDPTADEIEDATEGGRPAILRVGNPGHFVVVDAVRTNPDGSRTLLIRDPGYPGAMGCREIDVGGSEWNQRLTDREGSLLEVH